MTFWDKVAPVYDFFGTFNSAHRRMIKQLRELVPKNKKILELAAGTGSISLALSEQASKVLCTDLSPQMLAVAQRKAEKLKIKNISFAQTDILKTKQRKKSFDVVIASQVLHLIPQPEQACQEMKRVTKNTVILPAPLLKETSNLGAFFVSIYKLFGFSPKRHFNQRSYKDFLEKIGFHNCEHAVIPGSIPIDIAIWQQP